MITHIDSSVDIFARRNPFQIAALIVRFLAIFVIYLSARCVTAGQESLRDKNVNTNISLVPTITQLNIDVSMKISRSINESFSPRVVNMTGRRD